MLVQTCHTRQTKRFLGGDGGECLCLFVLFSPDIRLRHQQPWLGINLHPALNNTTTRVSPVVRLTDSPSSGCPLWWDTCVLTNSCSPSERRRTSRQRHVRSATEMCECVWEGDRVRGVHWVGMSWWWLSETYHLQSERSGRRWDRLLVEGGQQQLHLLDLLNPVWKWVDLWLPLGEKKLHFTEGSHLSFGNVVSQVVEEFVEHLKPREVTEMTGVCVRVCVWVKVINKSSQ